MIAATDGGLYTAHCARLARHQGPPALEPVEPTTLLGTDPPRDDANYRPLILGAAYLAALLAVDRHATYPQQLGLGVLPWLVLLGALWRIPVERRIQALGVVVFATVGEVTGSLIWVVYHYRLHNRPLFVPPAHGLVFLTGLSLAAALRAHTRALVVAAATLAAGWALLGLTVLPHRDVAGDVGVPLLLLFLWRARAVRHGDRHVALVGGAAGARHPRRQPAVRRRLRLRLVRRHGTAGRAVPRRPRPSISRRDR